jgi:glyoxylase-like metal-dependent hydrolase (beta-lactamase superfamily II)
MQTIDNFASSVFTLRYPLKLLGASLGRVITIFRLRSGKLVLHSTGPFTPEECSAISEFGEVQAIVEATNFHDTFSLAAMTQFANSRYFAPSGFPLENELKPEPIEKGKEIWGGELIWELLAGAPRLNEWVCFHPESKTLVVADLLFNCRPNDFPGRVFFAVAGIRGWPGNCRLFRMCIRDRKALESSLKRVLAWDFERVIVAHGPPIEKDSKRVFTAAIRRAFPSMNLTDTEQGGAGQRR